MILNKSSDCASISISSSYFSDFISVSPTVVSIRLYYTVNGGTELSYDITEDDIDVNTITLDPEFFEQGTETLCDGVYCFRLATTLDEEVVVERGIVLVDCGFKCTLAEKLWNNPESLLYSKVEAIKAYADCNACDCSTSYKLYLDLLIDLGLSNTPCGCSQ